ncbi:transcriptional regulator, AraC family [Bradyrhizobium sp. Rc3b]|uniref:helix-turn-helix domain-containing protein n=1 Tax=unclassified Bradyrhizobium TaxID=2631580 RepID=UPI0008DEE820|nr:MULTISPECIES: helix-turn-helix domain-containing protein [unclassified Bradyrhizobium]MBB4380644.1 AraC-like DNA-binding protein [Bradyrhizobium sp. SBR1B]SFN27169.1 transcriptional regulator, AraC family [Bradyrhizobium sp. Rc3b]
MTKIPYLRFDTAELPAAERLDRYRAILTHYEVSVPEGTSSDDFEVLAEAWLLGGLVTASTKMGPVRFTRTAALAKADGRNSFALLLLRRGAWSGEVDGEPISAGPGQVLVLDLTRRFDGIATATDTISLDVERDAIVNAAPDGLDLHGLVLDGAAGRVLADQMGLLRRRLPAMDGNEAPEAIQTTLGLLRGCFGMAARPREQGLARRDIAILHRASRFIDQNLGHPDLSVATICREIGVSRSVLYRVFTPLAGVADYIRGRRLEAIHVLLDDADEDRWNAEIAAEFGFVSQAHFSRSFRQRFGYSPRAARDSRDLAAAVDAGPELFREWINQLG